MNVIICHSLCKEAIFYNCHLKYCSKCRKFRISSVCCCRLQSQYHPSQPHSLPLCTSRLLSILPSTTFMLSFHVHGQIWLLHNASSTSLPIITFNSRTLLEQLWLLMIIDLVSWHRHVHVHSGTKSLFLYFWFWSRIENSLARHLLLVVCSFCCLGLVWSRSRCLPLPSRLQNFGWFLLASYPNQKENLVRERIDLWKCDCL